MPRADVDPVRILGHAPRRPNRERSSRNGRGRWRRDRFSDGETGNRTIVACGTGWTSRSAGCGRRCGTSWAPSSIPGSRCRTSRLRWGDVPRDSSAGSSSGSRWGREESPGRSAFRSRPCPPRFPGWDSTTCSRRSRPRRVVTAGTCAASDWCGGCSSHSRDGKGGGTFERWGTSRGCTPDRSTASGNSPLAAHSRPSSAASEMLACCVPCPLRRDPVDRCDDHRPIRVSNAPVNASSMPKIALRPGVSVASTLPR